MSLPREQHLPLNGGTFWTAVSGSGAPLLMLHGGPGACDQFGPVAAMLDDLATCIRFDQRGCGRTNAPPPYDSETFLADIEALRTRLEIDTWTVLGHSWGATLALAYALRHRQRVRALVLVSAHKLLGKGGAEYHTNRAARLTPDERQRDAELYATIKAAGTNAPRALFDEVMGIQYKTDLAPGTDPRFYPRAACPPNLAVNAAPGLKIPLTPGQLASLALPALFLHGDQDPRPWRYNEEVARLMPAGRFHLIPGAGHFPWVERPASVADAIRAFLREVARPI